MIEYADDVLSCSPTITTDDETACWSPGCHLFINGRLCSFYRVQSSYYWSSSSYPPTPSVGFVGDLSSAPGNVFVVTKDSSNYVWPVRSGQ